LSPHPRAEPHRVKRVYILFSVVNDFGFSNKPKWKTGQSLSWFRVSRLTSKPQHAGTYSGSVLPEAVAVFGVGQVGTAQCDFPELMSRVGGGGPGERALSLRRLRRRYTQKNDYSALVAYISLYRFCISALRRIRLLSTLTGIARPQYFADMGERWGLLSVPPYNDGYRSIWFRAVSLAKYFRSLTPAQAGADRLRVTILSTTTLPASRRLTPRVWPLGVFAPFGLPAVVRRVRRSFGVTCGGA